MTELIWKFLSTDSPINHHLSDHLRHLWKDWERQKIHWSKFRGDSGLIISAMERGCQALLSMLTIPTLTIWPCRRWEKLFKSLLDASLASVPKSQSMPTFKHSDQRLASKTSQGKARVKFFSRRYIFLFQWQWVFGKQRLFDVQDSV